MKTGATGTRLHPAYPHWYLETMGVEPAAQHKGIGGHLLEPVRDVDFYKRHGFVVETSSLRLNSPPGPT